MKFQETKLYGVFVIEPTIHGDHRGWFMETYNYEFLRNASGEINFVQDNHSFSAAKGTLRGLHYQLNPKAQTKLVRCTKGAIFDVVVDIQKGSPTFGEWFGIELSEENKKQLLVPKGFAHGFMTITDNVEVQYKVDESYSPEDDRSIIWDDPSIGIKWPIDIQPILSKKDEKAPFLNKAENNFLFGKKL